MITLMSTSDNKLLDKDNRNYCIIVSQNFGSICTLFVVYYGIKLKVVAEDSSISWGPFIITKDYSLLTFN